MTAGTDPTETLTRCTALRMLVGATALAGGLTLATQPVTAADTTSFRLSSGTTVLWEIDNDDVYRTTSAGWTKLASYEDATLVTPDEEPLCESAGNAGEGVGVFWEVEGGAAIVLVTGNVARVRRTDFQRTYAFEDNTVREWPPEESEVLLTADFGESDPEGAETTDFAAVNPLTKAIIVILLEEECGLETDSPVM